tara:strand:- start:9598 stop:10218 length:621 start_codon:yes stop_codon:yes gene_type:complete
MVSETEYLIDLLDSNWNAAITALKTSGGGNATIADIHGVHPIIMDIRDMTAGKTTDTKGRSRGGNRINTASKKESTNADGYIYSKDIIVISESGNSIEYPTRNWEVRHETYNMSISIRTRQDDRILNNDSRVTPAGTFGVDRIRSLYLLVRYILEQKRRGWVKTGSTIYENVNTITVGDRTESNDKRNRIFGYKMNVTLKRHAVSL